MIISDVFRTIGVRGARRCALLLLCAGAGGRTAALQIATPALSLGVPGVAYPTTPRITMTGNTGAVTWTISSGSVPGLTLLTYAGTEAFLNGTPTTAGFFPITVQVTDSATPSPTIASRSYIVEIRSNLSYFPPDSWEARGIFGGTVRQIRPSPDYANDATIVVAGNAGELFMTNNRGGSWSRRPVNPARLDADLHTLRLSPDYSQSVITPSSGTIFVASRDLGVWKSTDRGLTFAAANSGLPCDGLTACPDGRPNITGLALSPAYPTDNTLFATMGYASATVKATLWKSVNGGGSWLFVANMLNYANSYPVDSMEISPDFVNDGMMVSGPTCQKSLNGGVTWLGCGISSAQRITFSPDFATDRVIASDNNFSYDGGATFTRHPSVDFAWVSVVKRPGFPAAWYGVAWPLTSSFVGAYSLYRSEDCFRTMTRLYSRGLPPGIKGPADVFANTRLEVSPLNGSTGDLIFASPQGIHLSFDEGFSFIPRSGGLAGLQFTSANGAGASLIETGPGGWILNLGDKQWLRKSVGGNFDYGVLSPNFASDGTLFVIGRKDLSQDHAIFRSTDRGVTLTQVDYLLNLVSSHAFVPGWTPAAGTLYLGQVKIPGGPTLTGLRKCVNGCTTAANLSLVAFTDTPGGGRCTLNVSTDIYGVAVSPSYATDLTIFAALGGDNQIASPANVGLCRSVDGGATWQAVNVAGSGKTGPFALAPGYNQLGANGDARTIVLNATDGMVYRSIDGGATWTAATGLPAAGLYGAVGISPALTTDGAAFIAGGTAAGLRYPGRATGLWVSRDKGASFTAAAGALGTRLLSGLVLPAAFDANNPATSPGAVVATDGSGLWKSNGNLTAFNAVNNYKQLGDNQTASAAGPVSAGSTTLAVLAGTNDLGIFRSLDGGSTFDPYNAGLPATASVLSLWIPSGSPANPLAGLLGAGMWRWNGSVWTQLAAPPLSVSGNYTQFREDGVYLYATRNDGQSVRSANAGSTWSGLNAGELDLDAMDYNNQTTPTFRHDPLAKKIGPGPDGAAVVIASLWGASQASGPRYSTDSGASWIATPGSNDYTLPAQAWTTVRALGINAASGSREVIAGSSTGLYRSTDAGVTWHSMSGAGSGLEATSKNFAALISTATAFGTTDILAGAVGTTTGGVYLSGDGGEHWTQVNAGFDPANLSISSLITTSCAGCPVQYYSGSYGGGLYTRTITVVAPPVFPATLYSCYGSTTCSCATGGGSGPQQGGQAFKLCGSNFQSGAVIEFDGVPVYTNYGAGCTLSATQIVCNAGASGTPAHAPGLASIRVRNPDTRIGFVPAQYTYTGGASRASNLRVAKSSADAALTWSCAGCSSANPARVYRSQNVFFSSYLENYNGGIGGAYTNSGAVATAQSYFWGVE